MGKFLALFILISLSLALAPSTSLSHLVPYGPLALFSSSSCMLFSFFGSLILPFLLPCHPPVSQSAGVHSVSRSIGQSVNRSVGQSVSQSNFTHGSFRLLSVRLRLKLICLRPICYLAYLLNSVL